MFQNKPTYLLPMRATMSKALRPATLTISTKLTVIARLILLHQSLLLPSQKLCQIQKIPIQTKQQNKQRQCMRRPKNPPSCIRQAQHLKIKRNYIKYKESVPSQHSQLLRDDLSFLFLVCASAILLLRFFFDFIAGSVKLDMCLICNFF